MAPTKIDALFFLVPASPPLPGKRRCLTQESDATALSVVPCREGTSPRMVSPLAATELPVSLHLHARCPPPGRSAVLSAGPAWGSGLGPGGATLAYGRGLPHGRGGRRPRPAARRMPSTKSAMRLTLAMWTGAVARPAMGLSVGRKGGRPPFQGCGLARRPCSRWPTSRRRRWRKLLSFNATATFWAVTVGAGGATGLLSVTREPATLPHVGSHHRGHGRRQFYPGARWDRYHQRRRRPADHYRAT